MREYKGGIVPHGTHEETTMNLNGKTSQEWVQEKLQSGTHPFDLEQEIRDTSEELLTVLLDSPEYLKEEDKGLDVLC